MLPVLVAPLKAQSNAEQKAMRSWTEKVFFPPTGSNKTPALSDAGGPAQRSAGLSVVRQDYGNLEINRSVIKTPLKVGTRSFEHGLGVNSFSVIEVALPPGAKTFEAQVGVDNNSDTAGTKGTVEFIVKGSEKELYKSSVQRCGDEPIPVAVDIAGLLTLTLEATDGGDGCSYDQADWAEAAITLADGKRVRLDELPVISGSKTDRASDALPFSFNYGGVSSDRLLQTWPRTVTDVSDKSSKAQIRHVVWKDPAGGLEVDCKLTEFSDFPALDWIVTITNRGKEKSDVIDGFQALDSSLVLANPIVRASHGSTATELDFVPVDRELGREILGFSGQNGRASQDTLPFFNLFDKQSGDGYILGVGWSGQWETAFRRSGDDDTNREVRVSARQKELRAKLKPGESIRSPRILLIKYAGPDPIRGHNLLRANLLAHYLPRADGKPVYPPIAAMTWFTYNSGSGVTETNQLEAIAAMAPLGIDAFWLDAGWYGNGDWQNSVGSWNPRQDVFPTGLKPLGDASHAAKMKMVVWFEPERVQKNTTISTEHPDYVHGGADGGLFKLDNSDARLWMTDLLDHAIKDYGADVLRIDYNLEPLKFWQNADAKDGVGMTENRYMQGLYSMWDQLRTQNPGLLIDNCASGGRRIDLETVSRSVPLWRSDLQCFGVHSTQDQAQTAGLSLWIPFHTAGLWAFDPYTARSVATAGTVICSDLRDPKFLPADIKRTISEIRDLRELWMGDYYPLTPIGTDERAWMAWQFYRPDLGRGFAMFFRRPKVAETTFTANLRALDAEAKYEVHLVDADKTMAMTGKELKSFTIEAPEAPSSVLLTYRKL